jgi:nucleotide-binding universal stress UspA family protein
LGLAGDTAWRDLTELEMQLDDSGALTGIPHHTILSQGDVAKQIEDIVRREDIDLVVVGTRGREGVMKVVAGSMAENIFRRASCPVLVIGPKVKAAPTQAAMSPQRLLLATDFGPASRHALKYAVSIANQNHAKLALLHVIPPLALTSSDSFWYLGSQLEGMKKAMQVQTREQLKKIIPADLPLTDDPDLLTEVDFPVEGILRAAATHNADLIVLGLRNRAAGASSHNPWEIADRVVCGATVPVLTVKA